jgi:hypothetical protein
MWELIQGFQAYAVPRVKQERIETMRPLKNPRGGRKSSADTRKHHLNGVVYTTKVQKVSKMPHKGCLKKKHCPRVVYITFIRW